MPNIHEFHENVIRNVYFLNCSFEIKKKIQISVSKNMNKGQKDFDMGCEYHC